MTPVFWPKNSDLNWIVKDALEIEVNPNNMKTENGFPLNCLCKSLIHTLKECKEILRTQYMCTLDLTLLYTGLNKGLSCSPFPLAERTVCSLPPMPLIGQSSCAPWPDPCHPSYMTRQHSSPAYSNQKWRQQVPLKHWYPLHGATAQKTRIIT
jgi:hypothetical protein